MKQTHASTLPVRSRRQAIRRVSSAIATCARSIGWAANTATAPPIGAEVAISDGTSNT
jgi:hypothetical protein